MAREKGLSTGVNDASISFFKNGDTTAFKTQNITTDDIMKGYINIPLNVQFVDTLQMMIQWTSSAMSNKRFSPSYAIINYTGTNTLK